MAYDQSSQYNSALTSHGFVKWSIQSAKNSQYAADTTSINVDVDFHDADWQTLRNNYGWPALQYQAWARGSLQITSKGCQDLLLNVCGVLEFWVDDEHRFGGDLYCYKRAPTALRLCSGMHRVDVHLIRDVRLMGANESPSVSFGLKVVAPEKSLYALKEGSILPDIVEGELHGSLGSVILQNPSTTHLQILNFKSLNVGFSKKRELFPHFLTHTTDPF